MQEADSLFLRERPSGPPLQGIIRGSIYLNTSLHRFPAFPVHCAAGAGCDRKVLGLVDDVAHVFHGQNLSFGFDRGSHGNHADGRFGQERLNGSPKVGPFLFRVFLPKVEDLARRLGP